MAVFCQLCGQTIQGEPKIFHHALWPPEISLGVCMECFQGKPRCRECGLPMAADSRNGLCVTCTRSHRLCLSCGRPVQGRYYEFDGQGPYCQECYHQRPPCDVCNAPLTDEHWQLSDGRMICANCHATAIYTPAEAVALYNQLKDLTSERLGLDLNIPTGLALVDRNQLREVIRLQKDPERERPSVQAQASTPPPDPASALEMDPERTLGLYARRGMRRGIYVQTGLPRLLFLQVAAHEYAHAWQGENIPTLRDGLVHEGFAEWVAYSVLGFYGYRQGQERMLKRQDLYGQGLRWALDEEATHGYRGVIEACRRAA